MALDISYADFERLRHQQDQSAFSESGASNMPVDVSEEDWNKLTLKEKLQQMGGYVVAPNDPLWHDLAGPTGAEDGRTIQLSAQPPAYYGDPNYWVDPDKVPEVADGVYAFAQNNKTPRYQAAENEMPLAGRIILGATLGVFAAGALAAAGVTGAGSTAGIASTDAAESGGTLALNEAGTATVPYAGGVEGAAGGATAAGNYAPVSEGSTPIPGSSGATVVDHGVNAAAGASGARGAVSGLAGWYNGLSPGARMVLGTALSQGASGALAQHRQNQIINEQRNLTEQQRQDQIRRGYVAPFDPNAFRPHGIIDGQRTGG